MKQLTNGKKSNPLIHANKPDHLLVEPLLGYSDDSIPRVARRKKNSSKNVDVPSHEADCNDEEEDNDEKQQDHVTLEVKPSPPKNGNLLRNANDE